MLAFRIASLSVGILLLLALLFSYIFYHIAFARGRHPRTDPYYGLGADSAYSEEQIVRIHALVDRSLSLPFEPVQTTSRDGLRLAGKYYHTKDGAPIALMCHGYRSVSRRDFAGGYPDLLDLGYNVLLIDERAHGDSEGKVISFGVKERFDVLSWISFLTERFGAETEILLFGISMGAATVLMSLALDPPKNVAGIVADCPFSSPADILRKVGRDMKLPVALCMPAARIGARLFGGFSLDGASAVEAVTHRTDVPVLLFHGEADTFVPCEMSRKIAEAGGGHIRFLSFPGADHGLSFLSDPARYRAELTAFLDRVFDLREEK